MVISSIKHTCMSKVISDNCQLSNWLCVRWKTVVGGRGRGPAGNGEQEGRTKPRGPQKQDEWSGPYEGVRQRGAERWAARQQKKNVQPPDLKAHLHVCQSLREKPVPGEQRRMFTAVFPDVREHAELLLHPGLQTTDGSHVVWRWSAVLPLCFLTLSLR